MRNKPTTSSQVLLGKYRAILLAIVAFLICDFSVMTLNLYSSSQARHYAVHINFARQFTGLAQGISRTLSEMLTIDATNGLPNKQLLEDLREDTKRVDLLLSAFKDGGVVVDESGTSFLITPLTAPEAREHLSNLAKVWAAMREGVQRVIGPEHYTRDDLGLAQGYAINDLDEMLDVASTVIADTQKESESATSRLQIAQVVGFILALINFIYTILMSMRSLVNNDRRVAVAQKETDEILSTVREALFLLDPELRIGAKFSASMREIFHQDVQPGDEFLSILARMVSPATLECAREYVEVLFGEHVMEDLVQSLNPLSEIEARIVDAQGGTRVQYLSFRFNRVVEGGRISHLLVTVQDSTVQVQLAAELQAANGRARAELDVYLRLLGKDARQLHRFLSSTNAALTGINGRLRSAAERGNENYGELVNWVFRGIHTVKGDAASLGLDSFEALAHGVEEELVALRDRGGLHGDDMIRIAVRLDEMFGKLAVLSDVVERMAAVNASPARRDTQSTCPAFVAELRALCERVAANQNKKVRLVADVAGMEGLPGTVVTGLREVVVQLLRNAVTHGIEPPSDRVGAGKPERGTVQVQVVRDAQERLELSVRDDGGGLQVDRIGQALVRGGRCTRDQVQHLGAREIVMKIFEPGFTTMANASVDGGRGVGLDVVLSKVRDLGGHLHLSSLPNQFTEISASFDAVAGSA